ncbi:UDP-N-acetylmuramate: L-alanyl-gamma-D-glutamyl-meso-diaminopimelate ligase [Arcticibacter pallidicorallinus]|uniref:UDP-N-acetylmuramate: L-alanyl-gamma-D-glutamyl-meso-diaminopimelate ligase n=1 Tax=Arcticibacter pallidicorallinus TaxID=1259464 RepID=A0A2T0U5D1_9SPHI|nr:Mur ligase family protein [Arcticibacter pallidicorallinus]PRY53133.1 UDP-N-acetylmuramate: L-alanyl-gamma-D-glutamyl-meso-diaminopimelate ligase [Arcticibacter pallidicorallinus]
MRLHFIAIAGSAMHNLAIALKLKGYEISGSDDAIVEPSSSRLKKHGIYPDELGWNAERIQPNLDAVILGMHARVDNPELLRAQELGIKVYSYPEYIFEQSRDKQRVVIGGSHGKTTITSMILHVLQKCDIDFDYLVGAQLAGFETMVRITDAKVIVIEGDEYLASPIDRRPKFHLYHAHIGVISGIAWDHINVFPTFENYAEQFGLFIDSMEPRGTLFFNQDDEAVKAVINNNQSNIQKIGYSAIESVTRNGVTYLQNGNEETALHVFGEHNLYNMQAAFSVCEKLGVSNQRFYEAMGSFKGASRRLELLASNENTSVYKDFAHSPSKLKATVQAVKRQFPDRELVAVIELHTFSSLNPDFLGEYKGSIDHADIPVVYINQKTFEQKKLTPYDEDIVKAAFGNNKLIFFNNCEILDEFLSCINYKGKNLLLMSSGNFGGLDLDAVAKRTAHYTPKN